jgi:PAS domain S-box-containing protein
MHLPPIYNLITSLLPCLIPPYALRLNRVFGTKRVGWMLFAAFSLLAVLQLVRSWHPMGLGLDSGLTLDLFYLLIPFLLLTGMVHIETLFKERMRVEREEKRMRAELEGQVAERTAELNTANDELHREISLRRQGEAELRKSKEQYRFLFDENPLPMWILDLENYKFLAFNTAAVRHYGFTSAEFRALTAADLYAPEDLDAFVADCGEASVGVQPRKTWRHCRKGGALIEVEITAQDLIYGARRARLVLAYDVTPKAAGAIAG